VIKFVSDLRQVRGFLWVLWFPPPIKNSHDIAKILLKVALRTITPTLTHNKLIHKERHRMVKKLKSLNHHIYMYNKYWCNLERFTSPQTLLDLFKFENLFTQVHVSSQFDSPVDDPFDDLY
jgi:hypothetical protein